MEYDGPKRKNIYICFREFECIFENVLKNIFNIWHVERFSKKKKHLACRKKITRILLYFCINK